MKTSVAEFLCTLDLNSTMILDDRRYVIAGKGEESTLVIEGPRVRRLERPEDEARQLIVWWIIDKTPFKIQLENKKPRIKLDYKYYVCYVKEDSTQVNKFIVIPDGVTIDSSMLGINIMAGYFKRCEDYCGWYRNLLEPEQVER